MVCGLPGQHGQAALRSVEVEPCPGPAPALVEFPAVGARLVLATLEGRARPATLTAVVSHT